MVMRALANLLTTEPFLEPLHMRCTHCGALAKAMVDGDMRVSEVLGLYRCTRVRGVTRTVCGGAYARAPRT